ncbi:plasmid mobilization relaxosome protein MobC [Treponema phagedenis]|uniref:plasmid mobilization protein n=1 Tax=Treponema phagedenis TaxID=162 RepID=UPI0011E7B113|nr:plasmid mobilization relaxosome protein MobC [Treponema phagedenis]QEJ96145.1 plasmid mobilization relaxosome protein MobC [Treponema phagedenis]
MENRKRNIRLRFDLTDKEKELFERKKEESRAKSMSHFIRKTVLEKEIYEVALEPLRDLCGTLSIATNTLNHITKRVNQTGVIYKSDIDDMKKSIEKFSKEVWDIHSLLLKNTKEI